MDSLELVINAGQGVLKSLISVMDFAGVLVRGGGTLGELLQVAEAHGHHDGLQDLMAHR
ncbi:hypothetical protein [Schlesneria sp. T3-172]|uniref:hypothetical protein n=1 Tax=Schlesneria sphaerica TaxID=3373610 RepID=UPI0037C88866